MPRQICRSCNRTVVLVRLAGGDFVAIESEVIHVVHARLVMGSGSGGLRSATHVQPARRLHAELCSTYVEQGKREALKREQRAFNKKRNHGL